MRQKTIAGNWKMYKTIPEARELIEALRKNAANIRKTRIIVCPPALAVPEAVQLLKDSNIAVGAQNLYWEKEGAYTGEISAPMIRAAGASFVIIGHSERRQYFGETNETVNLKLKAALKEGLNPIVCVGETLEQRESDQTRQIIEKQIRGAFRDIETGSFLEIIIAYEPVWAIGTGKTATPEQAQEVHAYIRGLVEKMYDRATASQTIIQYGGSVKPENASDLLSQRDIDGALVGGACLKADSFMSIINSAEKLPG
jgi:triosephosphate isomerase